MGSSRGRLQTISYIKGLVVKGFGRGSKELGIPTANLDENVVQSLTLPEGIYFGFAQLFLNDVPENRDQTSGATLPRNSVTLASCPRNPVYPMVCSLGWNPQFQNKTRTLEVHIMNKFDYDFYGATIKVAICGFIRPEMKFDSLQILIDTIHEDIAYADSALDSPNTNWTNVINNAFFSAFEA